MADKQYRTRLATGSGDDGKAVGAFNLHCTPIAPIAARGNLRECLTALIVKAESQHEIETNPTRRAKLARLIRWLTHCLARCIMAEAGR